MLAVTRLTEFQYDVLTIAVLVVSVIPHEVAHGLVALAFGDDTAKRAGRLTLNPIRHVDPFGSVVLPALLLLSGYPPFAYAKPVPVSPRALRNPRQQAVLVSLAGPATNVALAFVATVAYAQVQPVPGTVPEVALRTAILVNLVLAVFNSLPVPPLDGSAVVERLLPHTWWPTWLRVRRYAFVLLIFAVLVSQNPLGRLMTTVDHWWVDHVCRPLGGCEVVRL